jgi:hypothetical protein
LIPIVSPTSLLFDVDDKAISGETSRTYAANTFVPPRCTRTTNSADLDLAS